MRLTKREADLVALLRTKPHTGPELACALGVSRRTVVREVAVVNSKLEEAGAGHISSEPTYNLQISSEKGLRSLLEDDLSDELLVLISALTSADPSMQGIAQETFLSRRALQGAVQSINDEYAGVVCLVPRIGQGIEVKTPSSTVPDILASLASENPAFEQRLEGLCDWPRTSGLLDDAMGRYLGDMEPYLSSRQAKLQTVAAMAACGRTGADGLAPNRIRAAEDLYDDKRRLLSELLRGRGKVMTQIGELLRAHGIRSKRSDLGALIFDHVVRCALFPTLMPRAMRAQMRDMRLRHPFEFDFGDDLYAHLREQNAQLLIEPDYLSLYVLASEEQLPAPSVSVLLWCSRYSMAAINRRFIEQSIENADVRLVGGSAEAAEALGEESFDLLVRDEEGPGQEDLGVSWDMVFKGVLSSDELTRIRRLALDALYRKNVERMLEPQNYLRVHNGGALGDGAAAGAAGGLAGGAEGAADDPADDPRRSYLLTLFGALDRLVQNKRLTTHEAELIRERELAGERLHLGGVAFPHAVTPVESPTFRLFAIRPDLPVFDGTERIDLIVVVLASQRQADKSSIFAYFLSVIERARSLGLPLPDGYEETLAFLRGDDL